MPSYATVEDYSLRTATNVPPEQEPTVQIWLDDTSNLITLYLGDCADDVADMYPELLTALTVSHVYRASSTPVGIRTESVGATSVSYDTETSVLSLSADEKGLLDTLIEAACELDAAAAAGVGQIGLRYDTEGEGDFSDVDLWILTGRHLR